MRRAHLRKKSVLCALVLLAPLLTGNLERTVRFDDRLLAAHNRERSAMGVEPLRWNDDLAQSAEAWAKLLAATGAFRHAPENEDDVQGENLWAGTKGYFSPEKMVDAWVREKKDYKPGRFPDNSLTRNVSAVGHYTQLIWRETREVGCAYATSRTEDVLVCRYSKAGNMVGERPI